jgi:tetratricopeptide (TPR) repeat protein
MIVRNEQTRIGRAMISASLYYDEWYITDTGSEDNTMKEIEDTAKIVERPGAISRYQWDDDYDSARNYALSQVPSDCDYILILDADAEVKPAKTKNRTYLTETSYHIWCRTETGSPVDYPRMILFKNDGNWKWGGSRHEVLVHDPPVHTNKFLQDYKVLYHQDSARTKDALRWLADAKALQRDHKRKPDCARTVFYMALSYHNAGDLDNAIKYYQLRDAMGGWAEEQYEALNYLAEIYELRNMPKKLVVETYSKASLINPERVEVLHKLSTYLRKHNHYAEAYIVSLIGISHLQSEDPILSDTHKETRLFIKRFIYDYGMEMELVASSWYLGFFQEGLVTARKLTQLPALNSSFGDGAAAKTNLELHEKGINSHMKYSPPFTTHRQRLFDIMRSLPFLMADDSEKK